MRINMIDISFWYIILFVQIGWILISVLHIFDVWDNDFYTELMKEPTKQEKDKLVKDYGYKNLILDMIYLFPLLIAMFIVNLITPNEGN